MIDNMKQHQQEPAPTASVNVTHTTATPMKTLSNIDKTRIGVSIATSMPPPPYTNNSTLRPRSGVYVSRVNNIRISQCTKTVRPYAPLKCSRGDDAAGNKRLCLDTSIIPTNMIKVSGKSSGGVGQRLSQVPQFVAVRRVSRGLSWPQKITTHPLIWHQSCISTTTTTTTIPRFAIKLTASLPKPTPLTSPDEPAPCHSLYPGSGPVALEKTKEVVQEHKEQRHMKAINDAFQVLRRALPWVGGRTVAEQRPLGATGSSKINTIKLAVRYIRALEHLLEDGSDDEDMLSSRTNAPSQSSSCSPSPSLSRKSLCSVGSEDFSDLFSTDSIEDLDALDELMSMSAVNSDALRADSN